YTTPPMATTRPSKLPALQTLVLGAVIMGTIFVGIVASGNFAILDAKKLPLAAERLRAASDTAVRFALRHGASELNRFYFLLWNRVQIALVLLLLVMEWMRSRGKRLLRFGFCVALLVLSALLLFWFTPLLVDAGRAIDFVPPDPPTPERTAFLRMHGLYM